LQLILFEILHGIRARLKDLSCFGFYKQRNPEEISVQTPTNTQTLILFSIPQNLSFLVTKSLILVTLFSWLLILKILVTHTLILVTNTLMNLVGS
jgi:hypothetical protein